MKSTTLYHFKENFETFLKGILLDLKNIAIIVLNKEQ
jgi:hypothetical protein